MASYVRSGLLFSASVLVLYVAASLVFNPGHAVLAVGPESADRLIPTPAASIVPLPLSAGNPFLASRAPAGSSARASASPAGAAPSPVLASRGSGGSPSPFPEGYAGTSGSGSRSSPSSSPAVSASATAAPNPSSLPPVSSNLFAGVALYVDLQSPAALQAAAWRQSAPQNASLLDRIALYPQAVWFSGHEKNVSARAASLMQNATVQGQVPLIVVYSIPKRDCGGAAAGGMASPDAYRAYVQGIADGLGGKKAIVVLEPDATASIGCLNATELAQRWDLLHWATHVFKSHGASVYVDSANPGWVGAAELARRLNALDVSEADGFALNVANFFNTSDNLRYGDAISALVGGKHFIVDTSRNGNGPSPDHRWCNPSGRALGVPFTTATGDALADALVWVKNPGFSDGSCRGGPGSGFVPAYALELAQNAVS